MRRKPRLVLESGLVPRKGRPRLWAYGYADLAQLLGKSEAWVRDAVRHGRLEPGSLEALCRAWLAGRTKA